MKESEIIDRLRSQNEQGMNELLIHYGPLMRYVIAPILPNAQDREDCLSEAAMQVWRKIGQFDAGRGGWVAWLTTVTRNHALNYKRSASVHRSIGDIPPDTPSPEPTPEERAIRAERLAALTRALQQLGFKDKSLFYRKYYYRQSTAQIAAETGMTVRAVEGKLYRIKKQLRNALGGDGHE